MTLGPSNGTALYTRRVFLKGAAATSAAAIAGSLHGSRSCAAKPEMSTFTSRRCSSSKRSPRASARSAELKDPTSRDTEKACHTLF
jgi:hypothetical protein